MESRKYFRRMSEESHSSSSTQNGDDSILKDCTELRQRLIETEKSLQNLSLENPQLSPDNTQFDALRYSRSSPSDKPPVLTLADLTPGGSSFTKSNSSTSHQRRGIHMNYTYPESTDLFGKKRHSSLATYTGSNNASEYRTKIALLREENSTLFSQNNKLMNQLESTSYQLQQCREELKELSKFAEEDLCQKEHEHKDAIRNIQEQVDNKNYAIKELEQLVVELRQHIKERDEKEAKESNSFKDESEQQLRVIEDLDSKCVALEKQCKELVKKDNELKNANEKLVADKKEVEAKLAVAEDEIKKHSEIVNNLKMEKINLLEQITSLKGEIFNFKQKNGETDKLSVECNSLKNVINEQQNKIIQYEEEFQRAKEHIVKLESLIKKLQDGENSQTQLDNGIELLKPVETAKDSSVRSLDAYTSPRSIIADLKLKLAMKDTELNKLQAMVASSNMHQQKMKSDLSFESCNLHSLRLELASLIEKTRLTDKKQSELEQTITRLEEENSQKTAQIIELNERCSDKLSLISSLESKLNTRNNKVVELQNELTLKESEFLENDAKVKLALKKIKADKLQLESDNKSVSEQLNEMKSLVETYSNRIVELETLLQTHENENKETSNLMEKLKNLHNEHCNELNQQIDNLRKQVEEKSELIIQLEKKLREMLNEDKMKDTSFNELREYTNKLELLVEEKRDMIEKYEEQNKEFQEKLSKEKEHAKLLEHSVNEYTRELENLKEVFSNAQLESKSIMDSKNSELYKLRDALKEIENECSNIKSHAMEREHTCSEHLQMLEYSQKHISELEDTIQKCHEESSAKNQEHLTLESALKKEIENLKTDFMETNDLVNLYQNQVGELNNALDETKLKLVEYGELLVEKDKKLKEQSNLIERQLQEIENSLKVSSKLQLELDKKSSEVETLGETKQKKEEEELHCRKEIANLQQKMSQLEEEKRTNLKKIKEYEDSRDDLITRTVANQNDLTKLERIITITQNELAVKNAENQELVYQTKNMKNLVKEQEWQLKQKSAEYTKLEMAFKEERSGFNKNLGMLESDLSKLKSSLSEKDLQHASMSRLKEKIDLERIEQEKLCEEYKQRLQYYEEANITISEEIKQLKEELRTCQGKVKERASLEEHVKQLKLMSNQMKHEINTLKNQLETSAQTVYALTQELDEEHNTQVATKADCTRLARELGSAQIREATLTEQVRNISEEQKMKCAQKEKEIENLRSHQLELEVNESQAKRKFQQSIKQLEDENKLLKSDLRRYKRRVDELESDVRVLSKELMVEQQKCKELDEAMVIRESEMARYSARLSGFERAVMKPQLLNSNQRNGLLRDDSSDISITSTIDAISNG